jgi:hypothetical protein
MGSIVIAWNAPAPHAANKAALISVASLDLFFNGKQHKGWHFFSVNENTNRIAKQRITSIVIEKTPAKQPTEFGLME